MPKGGSKGGSNKLKQFNKSQKAEDIRLTNIAAAKCTSLKPFHEVFKI